MNSIRNQFRPRVALFEPRIPQNTGTIGRSCLAFELSLDIIKPTGFSFEDKYLKRAGLDYWSNVDLHLYESFEEYKKKFITSRFIALTKKSDNSISNITFKNTDILLFGREDTGLPDKIMRECEIISGIPMPGGEKEFKTGGVRSLNLSVACGIVCYAACLQLNLLNN
ncbi:tRNA (cytidine(34)-2'-O)-methyltransferase [Prochlorococcus marinus]|uniref:Putative tRNA (cytidine(34)-2'-O)-methyltransferase n=1 Tax=Prochlorococcus marinus XMU1408 TaxID=2213228 RepID=A0A318R4P0_PROMR|nr:tRNA (cytidine(34)-2'-O)-methyltransferase [Prochlorococcus marinus]MBW3041975.1 rRNA methyltransferase [Prochlorococcus marinus str. XMU1408]PYE03100.1 rRNA methyltransferase [Prochlorococcus marinus XMU1408]